MITVHVKNNSSVAVEVGGRHAVEVDVSGQAMLVHDSEMYTGEYSVIPDVDAQILETKNKLMSDDVTVAKIPLYEVSNKQGSTIIIGGKNEWQ